MAFDPMQDAGAGPGGLAGGMGAPLAPKPMAMPAAAPMAGPAGGIMAGQGASAAGSLAGTAQGSGIKYGDAGMIPTPTKPITQPATQSKPGGFRGFLHSALGALTPGGTKQALKGAATLASPKNLTPSGAKKTLSGARNMVRGRR